MHELLLATVLLHSLSYVSGGCFSEACQTKITLKKTCPELSWSEFKCNVEELYLSNKSIKDVKTYPNSTYNMLTILDMSYNSIEKLPEDFLYDAGLLKELSLNYNILEKLPEKFLANASQLKSLNLEGNLLKSIPLSVFQCSLTNVTIDCKCDIADFVKTRMASCDRDKNWSGRSIKCQKGADRFDIEDFQQTCHSWNILTLYIALPIIVIVVIAGVVIYCIYQKKKKNGTTLKNKEIPDKSPSHGQPRYMTRNADVISPATNQLRLPRQDYENVVIGQWHPDQEKPYTYLEERKSKKTTEEDIYLESDVTEGDQPIYTNTQNMYYNYADHSPSNNMKTEEDDVYILPDQ